MVVAVRVALAEQVSALVLAERVAYMLHYLAQVAAQVLVGDVVSFGQ